jgi:hypothetical protein
MRGHDVPDFTLQFVCDAQAQGGRLPARRNWAHHAQGGGQPAGMGMRPGA